MFRDLSEPDRLILGLKRGEVRLVPHQPEWFKVFAAERDRLQTVFGSQALAIEHVGSTAVPDLPAKPVIDIAVAVRSLAGAETWTAPLRAAGYEPFGDREGWGEHFFAKGPNDLRTVYLHVVPPENPRWRGYLDFRDRLRTDSRKRAEYAVLKANAAALYPADRKAYTDAKSKWIQALPER